MQLARIQASRRAAMGSQPLLNKMPLEQAATVASLGAEERNAVFGVVGVARYDAISKL